MAVLPRRRRGRPGGGGPPAPSDVDQKPYFALFATSCFVVFAAASSSAAFASFLPVTAATAAWPAPWGPNSMSPAAGNGGKKRASGCCFWISDTYGSALNSAELTTDCLAGTWPA